jgi:hypothetical protein
MPPMLGQQTRYIYLFETLDNKNGMQTPYWKDKILDMDIAQERSHRK